MPKPNHPMHVRLGRLPCRITRRGGWSQLSPEIRRRAASGTSVLFVCGGGPSPASLILARRHCRSVELERPGVHGRRAAVTFTAQHCPPAGGQLGVQHRLLRHQPGSQSLLHDYGPSPRRRYADITPFSLPILLSHHQMCSQFRVMSYMILPGGLEAHPHAPRISSLTARLR